MGNGPDWDETTDTSISTADLLAQVPEQPSMLELVKGPGAPHKYLLLEKETVVGRDERAQIQVYSREVSRKHMHISRDDSGEFSCLDLESRNGVFLNGIKIHSASLNDGDNLQLGDLLFVFHQGQ